MTRWLWHRWGMWLDVSRYTLKIDGLQRGLLLVQHRGCLRCGKKESREIQA